jgi:histidinol-phosphate phosphatase family protein
MSRPVFWIDRDGTILDDPGYLKDPGAVVLFPGVAEAVARLNAAGTVVLVTNQSGIGRGYMDRADVDAVHAVLAEHLAVAGGRLDRIEICPHTPDEQCGCRKPAPGMILRARFALGEFSAEYVIGDKLADLELARATGCVAILVRTGQGPETERELVQSDRVDELCDHVADDLTAAADWILSSGVRR